LLARQFAGVDVRASGSGNIGATNVARSAGKGLGIITLLLDALKGATPVLVAAYVMQAPILHVALAGLFAVVGHIFPIYLRFKGGKGVATGLGVFLALAPLPTLAGVAAFGAVYGVTRLVSPGSLAGAIVMLGSTAWLGEPREVTAVAGAVVFLIFIRHIGNIRRLLARQEQGL
jgi:glycerol-3-phosphate acyltransferase PlsY